MGLSKREQYVALAALAAILLLAADRYLLVPLIESGAALDAEQARLVGELENATRLFQRRRHLARRWDELTAGGLTDDPAEAESRLLHALRNWAQQEGLELSAMKPERTEQDGRVREIGVTASGTGTMTAVSRFLWRMETAELPLRIRKLQLGSRKEGADELSLQLGASTLYLAPADEEDQDEQPGEGETG